MVEPDLSKRAPPTKRRPGSCASFRSAARRYDAWLRTVDADAAARHDDALYASGYYGEPANRTSFHAMLRAGHRSGHGLAFDSLPLENELCERWMELGSFPLWGNKFLCRDDVDLLARDGSESCTVVSVGSGNEWSFEEDVHRHFPNCTIDTFDCTTPSARVPPQLAPRVRFHPICLGTRDDLQVVGTLRTAPRFSDTRDVPPAPPPASFTRQSYSRQKPGPQLTWPSLLRYLGPAVGQMTFKLDCEGCEYEVLPSMLAWRRGRPIALPSQIAVEVHTAFEPRMTIRKATFGWVRTAAPPLQSFLQALYRDGGYFVVHRDDSLRSPGLSELVLRRAPRECQSLNR